jgi:hypothetical protein
LPASTSSRPISAEELAARTLKNREDRVSYNRVSNPTLSSVSSQEEEEEPSASPSEDRVDVGVQSQQCVQRKPELITQRAALRQSIDNLFKSASHESQPRAEASNVVVKDEYIAPEVPKYDEPIAQ